MTDLLLPPAFEPVAVRTDAFAAAVKAVETETEQGNFFSADASSRFDVAVVFAPEYPLPGMWPARSVSMLAAAEALAALGPPNLQLSFLWPDAIAVNGATVGGVRGAVPQNIGADDVPEWMVVGLTLRLSYPREAAAPGLTPEHTALIEEGFGDVTGNDLAESYARNLLYWIHQWVEVGTERVAARWLSRFDCGDGARCTLDLSTGDLLRSGADAVTDRQPLPHAGAPPSWSLTA